MKRFFYSLSFVVLLASPAAHAQITPEKVYRGLGEMIRLSNGDYKYQLNTHNASNVTDQVMVYNLNHSIYKQLGIPSLGAAYEAGGIQYVSDALFDTNAATMEYVVNYNSTLNGGQRKTIVYSETGSQLAVFDSTNYYVAVYNTPSGSKLLTTTTIYSSSNTITRQYTRVYGLPGRLALRVATPETADAAGAYPNPARGIVTLPYSVPPNTIGTMKVFDVSGRLAASYKIDGHIDRLELSTRDLRPGAYLYRVETTAGVMPGRRFVIE